MYLEEFHYSNKDLRINHLDWETLLLNINNSHPQIPKTAKVSSNCIIDHRFHR